MNGNYGQSGKRQSFLDGDLDDTLKVIDINLVGTINMSLEEARAINGTTVMADDGYTVFKDLSMKPQVTAEPEV